MNTYMFSVVSFFTIRAPSPLNTNPGQNGTKKLLLTVDLKAVKIERKIFYYYIYNRYERFFFCHFLSSGQ